MRCSFQLMITIAILMIITTLKVVIIALFYSNGVVSNFRRQTKANSAKYTFLYWGFGKAVSPPSVYERGEFEKVRSLRLKQRAYTHSPTSITGFIVSTSIISFH